jgi:hypothetical protein
MKDAYEVLRQKEADIARLRHEIASLQIVAPLLGDDSHGDHPQPRGEESEEGSSGSLSDPEATGTDGLFSSVPLDRSNLWNLLKRG